MSDSTSAPAGPAEGAAASDSGPAIAPPPASQPPLSVSEAGRLLSRQRRAAAGEGEATPPSDRKPSPNDAIADAAQKPADATAERAPRKPAERTLSAMERALGVPGDGAAPAEASSDIGDAIVEIEGQRFKTLDEVRAFAQRKTADYTQKTQELAAERQKLAAQQEALATILPYIQPELAKLAQMVQGTPRPSAELLNSDPQRYFSELAAFEQAREEQSRLGNLTQLQQQAYQRHMEQQVEAANQQLAKEFPFWADPAERSTAQRDIVAWATTDGGFSHDDLKGLSDARYLKTMMKAMQYDKWVKGAKTTAPAQRLQAPVRGTAPPPAPTERIQVAQQSFEERPSVRSGAALLAARRGNGAGAR